MTLDMLFNHSVPYFLICKMQIIMLNNTFVAEVVCVIINICEELEYLWMKITKKLTNMIYLL